MTDIEDKIKQYKTRNTVKLEHNGSVKEWIDKRDIIQILKSFIKWNQNEMDKR